MPLKSFLLLLVLNILATYSTRILPFHVSFLSRLPRFLQKCMKVLPVAALGALLFPGVITDFPTLWYAGLLGTMTAVVVARLKDGLLLPVVCSFLVTWATFTFLA